VYGSKVGQEVEIAESGDVGVDPEKTSDLLETLQNFQLVQTHPWNARARVAETQDRTSVQSNLTKGRIADLSRLRAANRFVRSYSPSNTWFLGPT